MLAMYQRNSTKYFAKLFKRRDNLDFPPDNPFRSEFQSTIYSKG